MKNPQVLFSGEEIDVVTRLALSEQRSIRYQGPGSVESGGFASAFLKFLESEGFVRYGK